ncbi:MAG: RusA family crossover junction endodeoxyribonuclease [Pseudomonadota bacterium]
MTNAIRPFQGKGKVQIASRGDDLLVRINLATSQTRKLKAELRTFLRKEAAFVRPHFGPFEVRIWTSLYQNKSHLDVDNIAKACLDALNGVVWRDDRQVVHLTSEKFNGDRATIVIRTRALPGPLEAVPLDEGLFNMG